MYHIYIFFFFLGGFLLFSRLLVSLHSNYQNLVIQRNIFRFLILMTFLFIWKFLTSQLIEDVERGAELSFSGPLRGSCVIVKFCFQTTKFWFQTDGRTDAINIFWAFLVKNLVRNINPWTSSSMVEDVRTEYAGPTFFFYSWPLFDTRWPQVLQTDRQTDTIEML